MGDLQRWWLGRRPATTTLLALLAARFKDPADDFRVAIVVDMWLTGFDVPCAHTMYLDKPLAGHNLMQAIARVNRVYGEMPGGLIVDLIGLADPLADALATYAKATGDSDKPIKELQDESIPAMRSAFEPKRFCLGSPTCRRTFLMGVASAQPSKKKAFRDRGGFGRLLENSAVAEPVISASAGRSRRLRRNWLRRTCR